MPRLTNPTDGTKGAWIVSPGDLFGGRMIWIEPNEFVDVPKITDAERKSFESAGGVVTDDAMDHDGDGKMDGNVTARRGRPPKNKG